MEKKREAIVNRLLANIETSLSDDDDVETAIIDFRQFIAALEGEANYHSQQFILENSIRELQSKNPKQDMPKNKND
jgi:hypothetical protein